MVDVAVDGEVALLHVEPPGVPPLQRGVQQYSDVLTHHSIAELKINATDHLGTTATLLLQLEQMTEEVEVGKNFEKCLTEMDEFGMCKMVFGWRLHRLMTQNSSRSLKKG